MSKQRLECLLLSILMLQCIALQLYWNGRAYWEGFNSFPQICQAIWLLILNFFHAH